MVVLRRHQGIRLTTSTSTPTLTIMSSMLTNLPRLCSPPWKWRGCCCPRSPWTVSMSPPRSFPRAWSVALLYGASVGMGVRRHRQRRPRRHRRRARRFRVSAVCEGLMAKASLYQLLFHCHHHLRHHRLCCHRHLRLNHPPHNRHSMLRRLLPHSFVPVHGRHRCCSSLLASFISWASAEP